MDDDLLSPDEIEALLSAAGSGDGEAPPAQPAAPTPAPAAAPAAGGSGAAAADVAAEADRLLDKAERDLRAAVSPVLDPGHIPGDLGGVRNFDFENFDEVPPELRAATLGLGGLGDVELDLRIELGRTELLIDEVMALRNGSVIPLDKLAGDPVDVLVNGRLVARGEVLVLNDNFCIRVAEILTPDD
ncbi:MAG: flagellar motor switch protein FliN [Planctomycetota bacterium]